jgi:O-antigen ligase
MVNAGVAESERPVRPGAVAPSRQQLSRLAMFLVGHVLLALSMRRVPGVSTTHAVVCLLVGIYVAARMPVRRVANVIAYIAASEVLWRMARASVNWEFGKYSVSLIILIALFRMNTRRNRILALGYFMLLLPSALLTLIAIDNPDRARQLVSFNLSGPLSITLCVLYFSNTRITDIDLRNLLLTVLGPVMGIAARSFSSIAAAGQIDFMNASNRIGSGNFGPNQVSAALGLGILCLLLLQFEPKLSLRLRLALIALTVGFSVQSALTFSRGGLALAFAGAFAAAVYLVRQARTRMILVAVASLLFVVGRYVVVPKLDEFTKGKFAQRYTSLDSSGRTMLAQFDLQIFTEHPVLGVGPGVSTELHEEMGHGGASHTEFTRVLAEHGVVGVISLLLLAVIVVKTLLTPRTPRTRALVAAFLAWFVLFMVIDALRMVAPAFACGVACSIAFSASKPRRRRAPVLQPQPVAASAS